MDRHQLETDYWNSRASMLCKNGSKEICDNWKKRRALIKLLLEYDFTGKNILEIGCGLAFTANMLMNLFGGNFEYVGTDISSIFLDYAKNIFGLNTTLARSTSIPFESESFDVLFAFDVLEHIHPDDQEETAKELNRVLKSDAMIFINNPDPMNPCGHNEDFEHQFNIWDVAGLATTLDMDVERIEPYTIDHGIPFLHKYQFIVMSRKENHLPITSRVRGNGKICDEFRNAFRLINEHVPDGIEKQQIMYHLDTAFDMGVRMDARLRKYKEERS
jgi:ubiquinone/menaquinone biosynthesis C-methylase UbiE